LLTVGARALTKHTHRGEEQFWPANKGSETAKNEKAEGMLNMFFDDCVWLNLHMLPQDCATIEVNNLIL